MAINRSQVAKKDTWDLEIMFATPDEWEKKLQKVEARVGEITRYKGMLRERINLLNCLNKCDEINQACQTLDCYACYKSDGDLGNGPNYERAGKIRNFLSDFGAAVAFMKPELSRCDEEYLESLLSDPVFSNHHMYIKQVIWTKKHLLSEKEESLLAIIDNSFGAPNRIYSKATDVDMAFKPIFCDGEKRELTNTNYHIFFEHPDRKVRIRAINSMFGSYAAQRNVFTEVLGAHVKAQVDLAKARNYDHVLDSFLYANKIPSLVFQTLFSFVNKNIHLLHRYCEVRKKAMGLRKLHWYDLYVPIIGGVDSEYTYDDGIDIIGKALQPLGTQYVDILLTGLTTGRWVDRYENKGKASGAYSGGSYDTVPYILLNFTGKLDDIYVMIHEAGHSMHTELARKAQPYSVYEYDIFLAEIASTMNENLLSEFLLKNAGMDMRAYILNKKLECIRTTFFRQTMFAEFEAMLYDSVWNGKTLTPDFIEKEYYALNKRYYGYGVVVDDLVRYEWSIVPHFFYNFYIYQYATGIASATYFTKRVLKGTEAERENYLNLLRAGGSDYSISILQKAGLDVTNQEYLQAIMDEFDKTLNEFEELIIKIKSQN